MALSDLAEFDGISMTLVKLQQKSHGSTLISNVKVSVS